MTALLSHHLAGRPVAPAGGTTLPDINPSLASDVLAEVPLGTAAEAGAAAVAAATALPAWKGLTGPARAEHLYRWAGAIEARLEELAQLMCREVGKPIAEARGEAGRCVVILRYYAGEAVRAAGEVVPAQAAGALQFTLDEPLGVVALITPWNFPAAIPLWKAAPALAFGNTVVLKPSEQAPLVALFLAETAAASGLPAGAFNVLLGAGDTAAALLGADQVRAVSFTGSAAVGAKVALQAAMRNIRFQTEMGGKNVAIVLPDADLDLAARLVTAGAMRYAGQKCTATSRAVVDRRVEAAFLDRLRAEVGGLILGPVTDAAAVVGPVISQAARERIRAVVGGAPGEIACGGGDPAGAAFEEGYYVTPTVVRNVPADAPLAQEELFGPVLAVTAVDGLDEALAVANGTRYGLSASLFTRDITSALQYVRRIEAGLVRVNGDTTGVDPHAPFGGMKGSSSGTREQGSAARRFYTETRTVQVHPA